MLGNLRILMVTSMFPPYCGGGVSAHVRDLALSLGKRGDEVWILTTRRGIPRDPEEARHVPHGATVVYCPRFRHMLAEYGRLARREAFDVVHFHSFNSLALAPMAVDGRIAKVFTLHSDSANYIASIRGWTKPSHPGYAALRLYERISIRFPDVTIAVSKRLHDYAEFLGARKTLYIPNAVDCDYWTPSESQRMPAQTILVPRMLVPKNGVEYAIQAMRIIHAALPNARMLIAGDGPLKASLRALAKSLADDAVVFLGETPRAQMHELYAAANVVIIPSVTVAGVQEATSIAALEAMACGLPVIASNMGGLGELIADGRDGLLVPQRDAAAIAGAVLNVLGDDVLASRIGAAARSRVLRDFPTAAWAQKILSAYSLALHAHDEGAVYVA